MSEAGTAPLFEPLIGAKQTGRLLGISERQAVRLIATGQLQGVRIGHRWLVEPAVLRAYVVANRTGEAGRSP